MAGGWWTSELVAGEKKEGADRSQGFSKEAKQDQYRLQWAQHGRSRAVGRSAVSSWFAQQGLKCPLSKESIRWKA